MKITEFAFNVWKNKKFNKLKAGNLKVPSSLLKNFKKL